jgi:hypothetical protein
VPPLRVQIALALLLAAPASAAPPAVSAPPPPGLDAPRLRALWREALDLEVAGRFPEAIARMEALEREVPDSPVVHWRVARLYWVAGEHLAPDDKPGRVAAFTRARDAAGLGLAANPDCAECMLWRVAAMGRLATTQGILTAAGQAAEMAALIDRGIALNPTYRDGPSNTALGNLYYAGAVFYRIVPDWFWVEWLIGVRGDKQRSVEFSRKAVAISESRIDYQVELGAGLLCLGTSQDDPDRIQEGLQVLERTDGLGALRDTDRIDLAQARVLRSEPERACGYSRDGWVELDEETARKAGL